MTEAGRARAWGWVAHLRDGGTTPWAEWRTPGEPSGAVIPGAQQLELLRRVNQAAGGRVEAALADRVLRATAPGRGLPELELVGAELDARFGTPPVDPARIAPAELLRCAAHLVAQDLVRMGPVPASAPTGTGGVRSLLRRRRVLLGDPWLRSELTRELTARGRPPAPSGRAIVVGADLPTMLADAWTNACFERPAAPWGEWLGHWGNRRGLPPGLNLARVARSWGEQHGSSRVEVWLDERDLPRALGVAGLPAARRPGRTAAELSRRVAFSLSLMIPIAERPRLLREGLLPRLRDDLFDTDLPVVPAEARGWVQDRSARLAGQLAEAGYPVRGRPWSAAPAEPVGRPEQQGPSEVDGALDLAVRLLLGGWKQP